MELNYLISSMSSMLPFLDMGRNHIASTRVAGLRDALFQLNSRIPLVHASSKSAARHQPRRDIGPLPAPQGGRDSRHLPQLGRSMGRAQLASRIAALTPEGAGKHRCLFQPRRTLSLASRPSPTGPALSFVPLL